MFTDTCHLDDASAYAGIFYRLNPSAPLLPPLPVPPCDRDDAPVCMGRLPERADRRDCDREGHRFEYEDLLDPMRAPR